MLDYVFDFKGWIGPCIDEIHGHTNPHIFLFRKNASRQSSMFYKNWSHDQWQPQDGVHLLKVSSSQLMLKVYRIYCICCNFRLDSVVCCIFACAGVLISVLAMCVRLCHHA